MDLDTVSENMGMGAHPDHILVDSKIFVYIIGASHFHFQMIVLTQFRDKKSHIKQKACGREGETAHAVLEIRRS
jgi:hypothetical protein